MTNNPTAMRLSVSAASPAAEQSPLRLVDGPSRRRAVKKKTRPYSGTTVEMVSKLGKLGNLTFEIRGASYHPPQRLNFEHRFMKILVLENPFIVLEVLKEGGVPIELKVSRPWPNRQPIHGQDWTLGYGQLEIRQDPTSPCDEVIARWTDIRPGGFW